VVRASRRIFKAGNTSIETPPLTPTKEVTANDLIGADGSCAGMPTPGASADANASSEAQPAAPQAVTAPVALGHTECDVVRANRRRAGRRQPSPARARRPRRADHLAARPAAGRLHLHLGAADFHRAGRRAAAGEARARRKEEAGAGLTAPATPGRERARTPDAMKSYPASS